MVCRIELTHSLQCHHVCTEDRVEQWRSQPCEWGDFMYQQCQPVDEGRIAAPEDRASQDDIDRLTLEAHLVDQPRDSLRQRLCLKYEDALARFVAGRRAVEDQWYDSQSPLQQFSVSRHVLYGLEEQELQRVIVGGIGHVQYRLFQHGFRPCSIVGKKCTMQDVSQHVQSATSQAALVAEAPERDPGPVAAARTGVGAATAYQGDTPALVASCLEHDPCIIDKVEDEPRECRGQSCIKDVAVHGQIHAGQPEHGAFDL